MATLHAKSRLPVKPRVAEAARNLTDQLASPWRCPGRIERPAVETMGTTREEFNVEKVHGTGRSEQPVALERGLRPGQDQGWRYSDPRRHLYGTRRGRYARPPD